MPVLLAPDEFEAVVALASEATVRRRVYSTYAWDTSRANKLAYHVASIRTVGYDKQLADYARQLGVQHSAQLRDNAILDGITQDSRGVAFGVLQTHNADLRAFLAAQPKGLSQRELSSRAREWQAQRATWKTAQIAKTELQEGRALAEADVMSKNGFVVLQRAEPSDAQCPRCKALVARGWMRPDELETPPLHPGCRHLLVARDNIKSQAASKDRLWLGEFMKRVPA